MTEQLRLFALSGDRNLGLEIARHLGHELSEHEERQFEDGEHKLRPLENVRNADVYVVQSLHGDEHQSVNDKLVRLLFFLGTLRDAGARHVTAVTPYLCYSRKDQQTKSRDPVSTRYVAQLFSAMGPDALVTIDVHNLAAFQNAFRCRTEHLEGRIPLIEKLRPELDSELIVVMSPDLGGVKRAHRFRDALCARLAREDVGTAFLDKRRSAGRISGAPMVVGRVDGATVLIVDDLIVSGTTIARAAAACQEEGARDVVAIATHGVFATTASEQLGKAGLSRVLVTNTVSSALAPAIERLTIVDISSLLAEAIKRLHVGGSIVDLLAAR